jgi:ribosomal subunit interface protein
MSVVIKGKKMEVGSALRTQTEQKLHALCKKYNLNPLDIRVVFSAEGSPFHPLIRCDIEMHVSHGLDLRAHKETDDAHVSLDEALETFETRLRRHKDKVVDHLKHDGPRE